MKSNHEWKEWGKVDPLYAVAGGTMMVHLPIYSLPQSPLEAVPRSLIALSKQIRTPQS
jgi:hypothetical protein